jgi:hypothetical protein
MAWLGRRTWQLAGWLGFSASFNPVSRCHYDVGRLIIGVPLIQCIITQEAIMDSASIALMVIEERQNKEVSLSSENRKHEKFVENNLEFFRAAIDSDIKDLAKEAVKSTGKKLQVKSRKRHAYGGWWESRSRRNGGVSFISTESETSKGAAALLTELFMFNGSPLIKELSLEVCPVYENTGKVAVRSMIFANLLLVAFFFLPLISLSLAIFVFLMTNFALLMLVPLIAFEVLPDDSKLLHKRNDITIFFTLDKDMFAHLVNEAKEICDSISSDLETDFSRSDEANDSVYAMLEKTARTQPSVAI